MFRRETIGCHILIIIYTVQLINWIECPSFIVPYKQTLTLGPQDDTSERLPAESAVKSERDQTTDKHRMDNKKRCTGKLVRHRQSLRPSTEATRCDGICSELKGVDFFLMLIVHYIPVNLYLSRKQVKTHKRLTYERFCLDKIKQCANVRHEGYLLTLETTNAGTGITR